MRRECKRAHAREGGVRARAPKAAAPPSWRLGSTTCTASRLGSSPRRRLGSTTCALPTAPPPLTLEAPALAPEASYSHPTASGAQANPSRPGRKMAALCLRFTFIDTCIESVGAQRRRGSSAPPAARGTQDAKSMFEDERAYVAGLSAQLARIWGMPHPKANDGSAAPQDSIIGTASEKPPRVGVAGMSPLAGSMEASTTAPHTGLCVCVCVYLLCRGRLSAPSRCAAKGQHLRA